MKQFNLEKALAGEPVVTRDGKKVTQLTLFETDNIYPLRGVIDRAVCDFTTGGIFDVDLEDHKFNLFMVDEKKSVWVNVYKNDFSDEFVLGIQHKTLERATNNISGDEDYIKTIEITNKI